MKKLLLLMAVTFALSACQSPYDGNVEQYKRDHDRYMRTHEPKTGSPDL